MKTIKKGNQELNYLVIITNNKHSYIKPKNGYLEIHLSKKMPLAKVIDKILINFDDYYIKIKPQNEEDFLLWGRKYKIILKSGEFNYQCLDDKVVVTTNNNDYKNKIYEIELKKYIETIKNDIMQILAKYDIKWVNIKYKKLSSKYGSYQTKKHYITLNTILAALEKDYAYYVLMHEYAHQKVFNHQKPFYDLLAKLCPNYKITQKNLRKTNIHF